MTQLPAHRRGRPGVAGRRARVVLLVVGTRGDARAWHFEVQGRESLELPAGPREDRLHLLREPSHPSTRGSRSGSTRRASTCRCGRSSRPCPAASRWSCGCHAASLRRRTLKSARAHPSDAAGGRLPCNCSTTPTASRSCRSTCRRPKTRGRRRRRGGYEIVDKFARKGIFIEGALAAELQGRRAGPDRQPGRAKRRWTTSSAVTPRWRSNRWQVH